MSKDVIVLYTSKDDMGLINGQNVYVWIEA